MKPAIVLSADDVRKIIADKFGVDMKDVIRNQYTFTVITQEEKKSHAVTRANDPADGET